MNWLKNLFSVWREFQSGNEVLSKNHEFVVYAEDIASYNQLQGYLDELTINHERDIAYVTSAPGDPLLVDRNHRMSTYYVNRLLPGLIPRLTADVFFTTMPDLGKLHVDKPKTANCISLYTFHSLNSVHEVYREGAFDNYDAFFCTGPHHRMELTRHFNTIGRPIPKLYEVGYYKLDRVLAAHQEYVKQDSQRPTILLAPSWGERNLLSEHGSEIVRQLLRIDANVVIRPHPCFHLPIYPAGQQIIQSLAGEFEDHPRVKIERSIESEDSFHEADLMISDYSGAAFEFAFGTLRPVLFVDVPRKTKNPRWRELGLPTFEDQMRYQVGKVIGSDEVNMTDKHVTSLLGQQSEFSQRLEELRAKHIYNMGCSAKVGAEIICDLLDRKDAHRSKAA